MFTDALPPNMKAVFNCEGFKQQVPFDTGQDHRIYKKTYYLWKRLDEIGARLVTSPRKWLV